MDKREITRIFKKSPRIGIHGTNVENIDPILDSRNFLVPMHYYLIGHKEKKLNRDEFYQRLRSSVVSAMRMSHPYFDYDSMPLRFGRLPSVLMAVENNPGFGLSSAVKGPRSSVKFGETFAVGSGIYRGGTDLHPFIIEEMRLRELYGKAYRKYPQDHRYRVLGRNDVLEESLARDFIEKMAEKLKSYN